jgi:RNase H-like domain found in reverse transcriptase
VDFIARQVFLKYPDYSKPFEIYTNTLDYQLGAVIVQDTWPSAFYSRKLNSTQRNYATREKELLSIFETSQQHCHILLQSHCKFYCNHKNLGFRHFKSECVRHWQATLEEFDYSFIYCPGKENTIADMLSRYPMTSVDTYALELYGHGSTQRVATSIIERPWI